VAGLPRGSALPNSRRALAISLLASLQVSLNHGARVFPHLLGFLGAVILISFTTPAVTASYSRKVSTAAARASLSMVVFSTNDLNFSVKSFFPVYSVHVYADSA
jgi:hypothetical protein